MTFTASSVVAADRHELVERGVPFVPTSQVPAVVRRDVQHSRQDVDRPEP